MYMYRLAITECSNYSRFSQRPPVIFHCVLLYVLYMYVPFKQTSYEILALYMYMYIISNSSSKFRTAEVGAIHY